MTRRVEISLQEHSSVKVAEKIKGPKLCEKLPFSIIFSGGLIKKSRPVLSVHFALFVEGLTSWPLELDLGY